VLRSCCAAATCAREIGGGTDDGEQDECLENRLGDKGDSSSACGQQKVAPDALLLSPLSPCQPTCSVNKLTTCASSAQRCCIRCGTR
jgi:hypothetical protein